MNGCYINCIDAIADACSGSLKFDYYSSTFVFYFFLGRNKGSCVDHKRNKDFYVLKRNYKKE